MYVILGETGDTDYEEMISGTHKTLIMKGVVSKGSEDLLRGPGSYQRDDVVPNESPLVVYVSETTEDKIANALKQLSKSGGMWGATLLSTILFYFSIFLKQDIKYLYRVQNRNWM